MAKRKVDWRELSGVGITPPYDVSTTPPILERARSEGDLSKNSYRDSEYPRLSLRAVCNDDGSPITVDVEELLALALVELRQFNRQAKLLDELEKQGVTLNEIAEATTRSLAVVEAIVPGIGVAAAYASDDQMGTVFSFKAPSRGIIKEVKFHDLDDEGIDKEIWLFSASPTLAADNAAFSIADADNLRVIAVFAVTTWRDGVNSQIGFTLNTPAAYDLDLGAVAAGSRTGATLIYGAVKTKGADNIAAGSEPRISMVIERYA